MPAVHASCGKSHGAVTAAVIVDVVVVEMVGVAPGGGCACAAAVEAVGRQRSGEYAPGESYEELRYNSLQPHILE